MANETFRIVIKSKLKPKDIAGFLSTLFKNEREIFVHEFQMVRYSPYRIDRIELSNKNFDNLQKEIREDEKKCYLILNDGMEIEFYFTKMVDEKGTPFKDIRIPTDIYFSVNKRYMVFKQRLIPKIIQFTISAMKILGDKLAGGIAIAGPEDYVGYYQLEKPDPTLKIDIVISKNEEYIDFIKRHLETKYGLRLTMEEVDQLVHKNIVVQKIEDYNVLFLLTVDEMWTNKSAKFYQAIEKLVEEREK